MKENVMHVNPNKNDALKDWFVKKIKIENFPVSIGQKELSINQKHFLGIFDRLNID